MEDGDPVSGGGRGCLGLPGVSQDGRGRGGGGREFKGLLGIHAGDDVGVGYSGSW